MFSIEPFCEIIQELCFFLKRIAQPTRTIHRSAWPFSCKTRAREKKNHQKNVSKMSETPEIIGELTFSRIVRHSECESNWIEWTIIYNARVRCRPFSSLSSGWTTNYKTSNWKNLHWGFFSVFLPFLYFFWLIEPEKQLHEVLFYFISKRWSHAHMCHPHTLVRCLCCAIRLDSIRFPH